MNADIEKLKALALAATKGPWQWWTSNSTLRLTGADGRDGGVLYGYVHSGDGDVMCSDENRAFIEAFNPAAASELICKYQNLKIERDTLRHGYTSAAQRVIELEAEVERLRAEKEKA